MKTRGRPFRKGNSGRPKGARHKTTRAIEAVPCRSAKRESRSGSRVRTARELLEAMAVIDGHFGAIGGREIFELEADPSEVLLMKAAEATGQVAAARDIRERYERGKG